MLQDDLRVSAHGMGRIEVLSCPYVRNKLRDSRFSTVRHTYMKVVVDSLASVELRVETGRRVELVTKQGARAYVLAESPSQGYAGSS
jgi:hypothetical protein